MRCDFRSFLRSARPYARFVISELAIPVCAYLLLSGLPYIWEIPIRDFLWEDPALSHPHRGDTVRTKYMFMTVPAAVVIYMLLSIHPSRPGARVDWRTAGLAFLAAFQSFFYTGGVLDMLKVFAGRLRPDFISSCKPTPHPSGALVAPHPCSVPVANNERMSFPSGHSCFAFYSAALAAIALSSLARRAGLGPGAMVAGAVLPLVFCGALIAISRTTDYRHHPTDAATGSLLGALGGVLCVVIHRGLMKQYMFHGAELFNEMHGCETTGPVPNKDGDLLKEAAEPSGVTELL